MGAQQLWVRGWEAAGSSVAEHPGGAGFLEPVLIKYLLYVLGLSTHTEILPFSEVLWKGQRIDYLQRTARSVGKAQTLKILSSKCKTQ